jgi:glycosyltransferase involved in cell wall biosynthesis
MQKPVEHDQPLVSVIIPNYNHAQYVSDAINSVLAQVYRNYEIIVVDDGSTDNSREVITKFGEPVQYIHQKNAGLSAARNTGIKASKGALIGVLDADDMYEPDFLSTLVTTLLENPDADGIYCGYQFVDHKNNLLPQIEARPVDHDKLYDALLDGNFFVPESIFLRRAVYDNVGLFDETLRACEDWDVWLRATKKYKIIHSSNILTRHRILPGSMSTDPQRMLTYRLAVLKKHVGDEPVGNGSSVAHRAYGRAYLGSCVEYLQYGNTDRAYECFQKLANIYPVLLTELDTFYQLGCGDQPKGSMGDLASLNVKRNSVPLLLMMTSLFSDSGTGKDVRLLERAASAKAYFALGMLAYGTREFRESRWFFVRAVFADFKYLFNRELTSRWVKSLMSPRLVDFLKNFRQRLTA